MSAASNFLNIFFPGIGQRRRQSMIDQQAQRNLEALLPFTDQIVQQPFQADTFGPEDPLSQLQAAGESGLISNAQLPGLFNQEQAKGLAGLLANPQTQGFGNAILSQVLPQQGKSPFTNINPKDYTRESISRFQQSGDFSQLEPRNQTDLTKAMETRFKQSKALRGEFTKVTKNFADVNDAFGRIKASSQDPSAAGDLSLIFNYMKVLDPESVVRESEFATAAQAGSYGDRIQGAVNRVMSGQRLSDDQRIDFVSRANKLFAEASRIHQGRRDEFSKKASQFGLNPEQVLFQRQFHEVPGATPNTPGDVKTMTDQQLQDIINAN